MCTAMRYSGNVQREESLFKYKQRVNLLFQYIRRNCAEMYWTGICGKRLIGVQAKLDLRNKELYSLFCPPDSVMFVKSVITGGQK
jgi:hypothetical protein